MSKVGKMLTARQRLFVDYYLTCRCGAEAARRAGYSVKTARQIATENLSKPYIKAAIADKEVELSRQIDVDKQTVIAELLQANETARQSMDAGSMIRAWLAVARILGLDQPESQCVELSAENDVLRARFESLSDEELLQLAGMTR